MEVNMGNLRNRFDVEVQIAACQMYMGNPSITQQEVSDHFGMNKNTLSKWLRKHGFSLKVARRKPMPTKAERVTKNYKVLKNKYGQLELEYAQFKKDMISSAKEVNVGIAAQLNKIAEAVTKRGN
tara:strand:- start:37 stop:411 length:375 start_codon:yes stop_codon:yes gene_type:complete